MKDIYDIKDKQAYLDFIDYIEIDKPTIISVENNVIETEDCIFEVSEEYKDLVDFVSTSSEGYKFDLSGWSKETIHNQGYEFKTF